MSRTWRTPRRSELARRILAPVLAVIAAATAAIAGEASIKGEILLPDRGMEAQSWRGETVVQVRSEPVSPGAGTATPAAVRLEIRGGQFVPRVLAVPAGTTIEIVNADDHIHNVVSTSPPNPFDLGMKAPNEGGEVRFDRAGTVRIYSKAETAVEGFVVVTAGAGFTVAGDDGRYEVGGLAPGTYVLEAWNPRYESVRKPLSIRHADDVVTANVEFRERRRVSIP